ncbi:MULTISPECIES: DNA-processing protein DprA [Marichromatium]|uniref:DNA protecting protein DprA n=1 Tax=Marichromatium gracile TaxID=1048 RepID=A0A4R4A6E6_MARGR|nr:MULTISPECIES: DNA-processing protein DprA [Marichromatium]MBO8086250.1 DNA-processing protein DprA [Marichromatium sp.]MBK1708725.1 DNA-protecting protein DprA [Marichromatium gracile]RNE91033.1 DNA-protecting protein DprA [Marichromatium sp. AB31]RNE93808.1 DNA-protecting protein DprA [Marichromatium sp. AB32]TCW34338.1 DNA protecting protein DprA [Marichromatium gracile]
MRHEALEPWLALVNAPGIGPRTAAQLLERYGDAEAILAQPARQLTAAGLRPETVAALASPAREPIERVLHWVEQPGAWVLTRNDPRYPRRLAQLDDAPPLLYVRGDPTLLAEPQVAVVGSRNPTPGGAELTHAFARELAGYGLVVTSGLASGVDAAAHLGALERGRTIAVLGTGPDRVYPAAHRELAHRIAANGALVSEFPPGVEPLARNFPRRNRLISGLSLGVLVTEAALKSGSLITARLALEQGREVFAVPGSVRNPLARGCHALIRDGARLVEEAQEVLVELAPQLRALIDPVPAGAQPGPATPNGLDDTATRVLEAMGEDPVAPDELSARTGLPAQQILSTLLVLELDAHVSSLPGGRYCRRGVAERGDAPPSV